MPRFLEIRLIGYPDDIEAFVRALREANILGSDSVNYPTKDGGKVRRYVDVILPGTNSSSARSPIMQLTDGK
ncbi:hypothetical protein [Kamptonema formosum]|uniref:hypothetical protein n=1 Tax=Kamptonema formosum TaxID=331992 RepID=UPI00034664CB|nr:hypothetical protein [Kamptonema formosum]